MALTAMALTAMATARRTSHGCPAKRFLGAVVLALVILSVRNAEAEPIVASAGVLSRLIFTDNLFLTAQRPEPAMIFQLTPNITGGRSGSRSSYRWYYGPSALFYSGGNADLNRVFHVLQANANVDIVKEHLALQFSANANQNLVDPNMQSTGFDAFGNPDAFAQTASISVAPVIQFPLLRPNVATVRFAPGLNYVFAAKTAEGARNAGSTGSQSYLTIASGGYFSRTPWDVAAFSNIFSNDNDNDGISSVTGTVAYPVSAKWSIQGLVGYEWGQYESLSEPGGGRWRVTPYWSPSRNTSIGLGYGWRYFGADYFASINHRYKKTVITMSYEVVVSNARTALLDTPVVSFEDAFGEPIISPASDQTLSGSVENPPLVTGVFLQYQSLASVAQRLGRTTGYFSLNQNRWDYQSSGVQVDDLQGSLRFNRALSRRTRGEVGAQYWLYNQFAVGAVDFDQFKVWGALSYQVNRRVSGSIRYFYNQRSSDTAAQSFDENGLWLTMNWGL
jgi:uncharacterized protein (PEP-CTERM system associated)